MLQYELGFLLNGYKLVFDNGDSHRGGEVSAAENFVQVKMKKTFAVPLCSVHEDQLVQGDQKDKPRRFRAGKDFFCQKGFQGLFLEDLKGLMGQESGMGMKG